MKSQVNKSRTPARTGRKPTQSAPLTRLVAVDALRTWVVPTAAGVIGFLAFVLYNAEVVDEALAVTTVGTVTFLTLLFFGLRGFFEHRLETVSAVTLAAFATLWLFALLYPFYRTINPGTPVLSAELSRNGSPVVVPLRQHPGRYDLVVEGHFLPAEGHSNRTATYSITVGLGGTADRVLQGTFSETWGTQRIGSGRRSSLVPSMHQTTQVREAIDIPGTHDLTLQLTELSPGVRDGVAVHLYTQLIPQWALLILSLLVTAGALLIDAWRPKGTSEGLMTTLTIAGFIAFAVFRASSPGIPGFPQLVVAALMGTLGGAVAGSLLWRLAKPLKKRLAHRR